jgi:hypothetical protein
MRLIAHPDRDVPSFNAEFSHWTRTPQISGSLRLSDYQAGAAEHRLHLMSSYFGFCAVFMLWLAFRVHCQGVSQSSRTEPLSLLPSPRHAH